MRSNIRRANAPVNTGDCAARFSRQLEQFSAVRAAHYATRQVLHNCHRFARHGHELQDTRRHTLLDQVLSHEFASCHATLQLGQVHISNAQFRL